jgi:hypothetical protein
MSLLRKIIRTVCALMCLLLGNQLQAQQFVIKGTVTDAFDGQTLPGVTVAIKGTTQGTSTDFDGKFVLSVSQGNELVFLLSVMCLRRFESTNRLSSMSV